MPEHVTFAPRETISADGKAGIFILNPKTGAAEGWVGPATHFPGTPQIGALPFTFTVGGVSADGSKILYQCLAAQERGSPMPCGGGARHLWYLLDTRSGAWARLDGYDGGFLSISPDGATVLGVREGQLVFGAASEPSDVRRIALSTQDAPLFANWAPDGRTVLVRTGSAGSATTGAYLVSSRDAKVTALALAYPALAWSADGAKLALATQGAATGDSGAGGRLLVISRDGATLWSRGIDAFSPNPRWSADGTLLSVDVYDELPSATAMSGVDRLDVYEGATGATAYRVKGAMACQGPVWAGNSHRIIVGRYFADNGGSGESLVDLDAVAATMLPTYVTPEPNDATEAIAFDGQSFRAVDLRSGAARLIAKTTVTPSWDPLHGLPLFAGGRIMFTALHGGHGGCAEGAAPDKPPRLSVLRGPFVDDGPVTRGG